MVYKYNRFQLQPDLRADLNGLHHRLTQTRIRVCIPQRYQQEPVLSHLISRQGLKVNITAALLGGNAKGDGWFDLQLEGTREQINSALIYLSDLDVEIWRDSDDEPDGW